jgi:hypothetical protein
VHHPQRTPDAQILVIFEGVLETARTLVASASFMPFLMQHCLPHPEQALDAEIVVVFEGVSETGALFSGKRSYLPTEIHWGYVFAEITHQSKSAGHRHCVDLSRRVPSSMPLRLLCSI